MKNFENLYCSRRLQYKKFFSLSIKGNFRSNTEQFYADKNEMNSLRLSLYSLVPRPLFPFLFVVAGKGCGGANKNGKKRSGNETILSLN